ncbi:MAG: hydroxymethylglutaryl-CoA lyase [Deltaproteobacteria bacterium]|nr:hydroxymethylglutaryl-CoA lyase [Deltaproteobacteria bacterium]
MLLEHLPSDVTIYEVGPRDGLQNESRLIPTARKIDLINALSDTGLHTIEITSFVNPKWIPQLADALEVAQTITRKPGVGYSALVPNARGLETAMAGGMKEIAVFLSASETHSKRNINKSIAEALEAFAETVPPALAQGVKVRAYVSTVYGCPYEGAVDPEVSVALSRQLYDMGCYQVSLGDTIGVANPRQVRDVLTRVQAVIPNEAIAVHFHDTRGTALANILVSVDMGITVVDSALGGLGGCPYAPGASGNVATEDVVYMLEGMGIKTGVDLDKLVECSQMATALVGHEMPSKVYRATIGQRQRTRTRSIG